MNQDTEHSEHSEHSADAKQFIAGMPKVELHVHLVGSASMDTVLTLSRRHPECGVPTESAALREFYEFTDFAHFIDVYVKVNRLVTTAADITTLVTGLAADQAANGVRYAEITVTPAAHLPVLAPDELAEALTRGRENAAAEHGVELAWVFDIPGSVDRAGARTIDWVLKHRPEGSVAFGLGGPEIGVPRDQFRNAFAAAADAGLRSVPHAGETTGPETVWSALRDLGAQRIGHGTNAVSDPRLLAHLADHGIPLEVCPTSNACTKAVGSLADHPLPVLLDANVPVTLATDDPGMFHTDLNREYLLCHQEFGMGRGELAALAETGIQAAFCAEPRRAELLAELRTYVGGVH